MTACVFKGNRNSLCKPAIHPSISLDPGGGIEQGIERHELGDQEQVPLPLSLSFLTCIRRIAPVGPKVIVELLLYVKHCVHLGSVLGWSVMLPVVTLRDGANWQYISKRSCCACCVPTLGALPLLRSKMVLPLLGDVHNHMM